MIKKGAELHDRHVYDWAVYELYAMKRLEASGIDCSDLKKQVISVLQEDLFNHLGCDDLTI